MMETMGQEIIRQIKRITFFDEYDELMKIVVNWWTSYIFLDFNIFAGVVNPAVFLNGHSAYTDVLFFELRFHIWI